MNNITVTGQLSLSAQENEAIERRIAEIKERLGRRTGAPVNLCGSKRDIPPHVLLQFWESILAVEEAEQISIADRLAQHGHPRPKSSIEIGEGRIHHSLWALIRNLASVHIFLFSTDHLSDRELYEILVDRVLHDEIEDLPLNPDSSTWIDISDYDENYQAMQMEAYNRADDDHFPDWEPTPKCDRDRKLERLADRRN